MKIGICTSVGNASAVKTAGWDYIEESVQGLLHAHDQTADKWRGGDSALSAILPVSAANSMVPADLNITGPDASPARLAKYMTVMLSRAQRVGIRTIVFGSGAARNVPDGFDRARATEQIAAFLRSAAPVAEERGVTLAVEHLNRGESNILTTVTECAELVRKVNHPSVQLLFDTFHFWTDDLPMDQLRDALPLIRHVHLADKAGRTAPGQSGSSDYGPIFRILKEANYSRCLSVEATAFDIAKDGQKVAKFIRDEWSRA